MEGSGYGRLKNLRIRIRNADFSISLFLIYNIVVIQLGYIAGKTAEHLLN
jgi:hypothetical protein